MNSSPPRQLLRELLKIAQDVRSRLIPDDRRLEMHDTYRLCYHLAHELRGDFSDLRITVGDRIGDHGAVQHLWLEIPSRHIYIDPACDQLDPFHPIRVALTTDSEYTSTYRNALDSNIDVTDPRNRPELLFKPKTAWDREH